MISYASLSQQGLLNSEVTSTANITTTSGTAVLLTGMTQTPVAGTYLLIFSTWVTQSAANNSITLSAYVNAVQRTDTVRTATPFPGGLGAATLSIPVSINAIITTPGAQAIEIRWLTSAGTATAHQCTYDLIKIG